MGAFSLGIKHVLRDFSCWTSTHGVPHIGMANAFWLRGVIYAIHLPNPVYFITFWILVVLCCVGGFIWQFEILLKKYLSYAVNTETKLEFSERKFPVVSICHLNAWKQSESTLMDPEFNDLVSAYTDRTSNPDWGFDTGLFGDRQRKASKLTSLFGQRLLSKSMDTNTSVSYTYDDLVASCTYNAKTCNQTEFEHFYDPTYGNCQKFNADGNHSSTRAGPLYGLRMIIKTDQDTYLPWTEAAGVVIVIHGQDEIPYPDVLGYFAPPGTASSMGVRYLETTRSPAPYGQCTEKKTLETPHFQGEYAVEACFRSCIQNKIIDDCGCYDPSYPNRNETVQSCGAKKDGINTNLNCIDRVVDDFNIMTDCDCPQPCNVSTYSVTVSTAQWPSNPFKPTECKDMTNLVGKPWSNGAECLKWYKKNTLLVEIYYERMNYQILSESPAYSMVNLVSDVGGQVGLFLGMSIISVVEFIFLFILICCYCATHKQRRLEMEEVERERQKAKAETDRVVAKTNKMYDADDDPIPPKVQVP